MNTPHWLSRTGSAMILAIFVGGAYGHGYGRNSTVSRAPSVPGGDSGLANPEQQLPPQSATLLHRLAESADAFRTGETVYLVASDSFPHPVLGGFATRGEAASLARQAGPSFHVYPVRTPRDLAAQEQVILPGCYKNDITTQYVCPREPTMRALRLSEMRDIVVVYRLRSGDSLRMSISADSVSAMMFTIDAFDRFIVPYYVKLFGPAYVARMRDSVLRYAGTAGAAR